MTSSGLAFTALTLVATLAALDLSGAHQLPTAPATATPPSVVRLDMRPSAAETEGRVVQLFMASQDAPAVHDRALLRCVTVDGAGNDGPDRYCFGAPAPQLIYD